MAAVAITVTEFSCVLSNFLSQVQYQGKSLDIQRGKQVIARVLPAVASSGFPIDQLDDELSKGPQLSASERLAMAQDVGSVRNSLKAKTDPWA